MMDIIDTIRSLENLKSAKPATDKEIENAEIAICVHFSEEYKKFLAEFGAISAKGIELTGIIDADYLNVVSVTQRMRKICPNVPSSLYVVEDTAIDGIVIWQNAKGEIFRTSPFKEPIKLADSLAEYINTVG